MYASRPACILFAIPTAVVGLLAIVFAFNGTADFWGGLSMAAGCACLFAALVIHSAFRRDWSCMLAAIVAGVCCAAGLSAAVFILFLEMLRGASWLL